MSAKNVLLTSQMVAKLADLGVARIALHMRVAATMIKVPGASVYMPPEAIAPAESNDEKAKYDASIDIFSFGVVTIFTVGEPFPVILLQLLILIMNTLKCRTLGTTLARILKSPRATFRLLLAF